jgi:hypothetical protein
MTQEELQIVLQRFDPPKISGGSNLVLNILTTSAK